MIHKTVTRAKCRSTMDLSNWDFQIQVGPEDETLNTIKTPFGTFACKVMLQSDTNAPSTGMQVMEFVPNGLIGKTVWAYLHDSTIFSDTNEYHIRDIRHGGYKLLDHTIIAFPSKCKFFADQHHLLGQVIEDQGIHSDSVKIREIQDWHTHKSKNK